MFQHPIPQNISTYQFHLIGSLTLKQFTVLIIGIGLAILLYTSNLVFIVKAPLMLLCVVIGFATALMPFDDRSLDQWFGAFIKAIYAPTQFIWKKHPALPSYFTYSPQKRALTAEENQALFNAAINKKRDGLSSYLQTISENTVVTSLEKIELGRSQRYLSLFSSRPAAVNIKSPLLTSSPPVAAPPIPPVPPLTKPQSPAPPLLNVPALTPVAVQKIASPIPVPAAPKPLVSTPVLHPVPQKTILYPAGPSPHALAATVSKKLPFPSRPTTPNTVVGMIFDQAGNIIENAIIEIRDQSGNPVRATKTNRLGQFFSSTPLKNGHYELEIDSPPHRFAILKLELVNQILDPLEIRAIG